MAVYKEPGKNTWRVLYRTTDWKGEEKQSTKRGFKTKREALAWEREMLNKATGDLDMTFKSFIEHYTEDVKPRLKENTWETKDNLIQTKFLPYFGKLKMNNIMPQQIIAWQNEMMNYRDENGEAYSPVYLKTIHNQLSAIFNHAVKYYNLREKTYRNNQAICEFANSIYSNFKPCEYTDHEVTGHDGVFMISEDNVDDYLAKRMPT